MHHAHTLLKPLFLPDPWMFPGVVYDSKFCFHPFAVGGTLRKYAHLPPPKAYNIYGWRLSGENLMRFMIWLTTLLLLASTVPAGAMELTPLVDCSLKVFRGINKTQVWSGKAPEGCQAGINVEKRVEGVFVTTWIRESSEQGWALLSLSSAMGFFEVADKKELEKAERDVTSRAARIGRCLDSIIRVNDPLECRDYATKTYSAGDDIGIEYKRTIWLDDNGRHSVVEYDYGTTRATIDPPVELFNGPSLTPGMELDLFDIE